MTLAHSVSNMDFHWDHAFACFVPSLLVAWDTSRMAEPPDDQVFVVDHQLQTVGSLGLAEALPCLLKSKRWEEHYMAWESAVAVVALENVRFGLIVAAEHVAVAHLTELASAMRPPLVVAVPDRRC
jgi:hypothetical protein